MIARAGQWTVPPAPPRLAGDAVHVWRAALAGRGVNKEQLARKLAPEERARAERFHFERDRRRYVAGRGLLREILACYLGTAPQCLQFTRGPQGKPALAGTGGGALRFNLSHSQDLALLAVAWGREVGVDLEYVRPLYDIERLAGRVLTPRENALWRALPPGERQPAFFRYWTRKEAVIKARGEGLARALDCIDVSVAPEAPVKFVGAGHSGQETISWSVHDLAPAPGYVAALAVQGDGWHLACWQWPPASSSPADSLELERDT